ncbi:hypothetical protein [Nocardia sp. NPDC060259]|uniref:hypothetical protein n=1 Tax=Nocardia sp. NPDC060259 TaxID=3347088 RepID=UPI003651ABE5
MKPGERCHSLGECRKPFAHTGETFDLTDPCAFTLPTAAAAITEVLGCPYRFVGQTVEQAYDTRASFHAP